MFHKMLKNKPDEIWVKRKTHEDMQSATKDKPKKEGNTLKMNKQNLLFGFLIISNIVLIFLRFQLLTTATAIAMPRP